jgi:hypothetical protein
MPMTTVDALLRELATGARALEPDDAAIDVSVRRALRPRRRRRFAPPIGRPVLAAVAAAVVLTGGAFAVPVTRAAIVSAFDSLFGDGGGQGTRLSGNEIPAWIEPDATDVRTIAGTGSGRLIAYREGGAYCVAYGDAVGECSSREQWLSTFAEHRAVLRGPTGAQDAEQRTLYGLSTREVASVRMSYESGPPSVSDARAGGFAIAADMSRTPRELALLDANGGVLETIDVSARIRG